METLMRVVYGPAQPFLWHPERAQLVAVAFALLCAVSCLHWKQTKLRTPILCALATVAWIAFGWNEQRAQLHRWDIRVDLLFDWPPLMALSVAAAWLGIRSLWFAGDNRPSTTESKPSAM